MPRKNAKSRPQAGCFAIVASVNRSSQRARLRCPLGTVCFARKGHHQDRRLRLLARAEARRRMRRNLSAWASAKHFTSWLGLAPNNKISGGRVLSSRTKLQEPCGCAAAAYRRHRRADRHRARRLLQTALGTGRQGQSGHRHGAQDCSSLLQRRASRHGICRPWRVVVRDAIPDAGWSKICTVAPGSSVLSSSRLSRQPGAPFLQELFSKVSSPILAWSCSASTASAAGEDEPLLPSNTSAAPPSSCAFHAVTWFGWTSNELCGKVGDGVKG